MYYVEIEYVHELVYRLLFFRTRAKTRFGRTLSRPNRRALLYNIIYNIQYIKVYYIMTVCITRKIHHVWYIIYAKTIKWFSHGENKITRSLRRYFSFSGKNVRRFLANERGFCSSLFSCAVYQKELRQYILTWNICVHLWKISKKRLTCSATNDPFVDRFFFMYRLYDTINFIKWILWTFFYSQLYWIFHFPYSKLSCITFCSVQKASEALKRRTPLFASKALKCARCTKGKFICVIKLIDWVHIEGDWESLSVTLFRSRFCWKLISAFQLRTKLSQLYDSILYYYVSMLYYIML